MSRPKQFAGDLKVLSNERLNELHYLIKFEVGEPFPDFQAGQFAELKVADCPDVFLRRPISIHDVDKHNKSVSMLIKIVGEGSKKMSTLAAGEVVNVVFPLGHGFNIKPITQKKLLLVGGGCGVAPLLYLARMLHSSGYSLTTLIGGKSKYDILRADAYKEFGDIAIMTEDGSYGSKGIVTDHPLLQDRISENGFIYACGPNGMMKAIGELATKACIPCEVSLENLMACGIGACLCCTAPTTAGNLRTCVEGPVFDVTELTEWTKTKCHG